MMFVMNSETARTAEVKPEQQTDIANSLITVTDYTHLSIKGCPQDEK